MTTLINKDGLSVTNNPKAIHEELFRGTGSVMVAGVSVFIQNENITEKYIVVFKENILGPVGPGNFGGFGINLEAFANKSDKPC